MSITAKVAVQLLREDARLVFAPGEPLPELTAAEERDLIAAGVLEYPPTEFSSSSEPEEARAGAGNPGTSASAEPALDTSPARPDESVPELARETEPAAAAARKPRSK
ncbi:MAG TPA: hypothetical protein PLR02_07250 [Rhodocyclaceae bacterium]|nr:hypothetical protein [Rhodocyclaceae bacterium]